MKTQQQNDLYYNNSINNFTDLTKLDGKQTTEDPTHTTQEPTNQVNYTLSSHSARARRRYETQNNNNSHSNRTHTNNNNNNSNDASSENVEHYYFKGHCRY